MSELNPTFMDELKKAISSTRFSIDDFTYDGDEAGELLRIVFKYDNEYSFVLSEEGVIEEDPNLFGTGTISKTVTRLFSYESPGRYKKSSKINVNGFEYVSDRVVNWCGNLHRELALSGSDNEEDVKRAIKEQFEFNIQNPESKFTKEEVEVLYSKLDSLYEKFKDLSDRYQISESQLESLHDEIEKLKDSASKYKKGLWSNITRNKITDLIFTLLKSKEGRELIFDSIKRIGS
jgi:hypothetical protein